MSINIPHADALVEELEERVTGVLTSSEPRIESVDKYEKSSIDIAVDGVKIGTVDVFTYENAGVPRIHRVRYEGRMPGYVNDAATAVKGICDTDEVILCADEFDEESQVNLLSPYDWRLEVPNNTRERPMYRQDGHTLLRLANYEVDGKERRESHKGASNRNKLFSVDDIAEYPINAKYKSDKLVIEEAVADCIDAADEIKKRC